MIASVDREEKKVEAKIASKSLKVNYIYNMLLNVLNLVFPLITFPYVSRILGSTGVGKVAFAASVVQYFTILGSLGLPLYGIREIAKARDSLEERSKIFTELFTIGLIANAISMIILFILINTIPRFEVDKTLFYVTSINMVLNVFSIDWLFSGLEEYKYIALRSIIVKIISIIALFIFVKDRRDYIFYAMVNVIALSGSNLLNAISLSKFVKFNFFNINIRKHMKSVLIIFTAQVATSIYVNLDTTMLGFLSSESSVGYYSSAIKLNRIVVAIVTSIGAVVTPRISYYIKEKLIDEVNRIISFSLKFIMFVALPSMIGLAILAPQIIEIFSGQDFIPAVKTMRIINPVILVIGFASVTSTQILLPSGREKYITISVIAGAITNCTLNFILIPVFHENGAAAATVAAEFVVLMIQIYYSKDLFKFRIFTLDNIKYVISSLVMAIVIIFIGMFVKNDILLVLASIVLGGFIYLVMLVLLKDEITKEVIVMIKRKLKTNID